MVERAGGRMDGIAATARALGRARVGSSYWFWFCPDAPIGDAQLVMSKFSDKGSLDALDQLNAGVRRPMGAETWLGIASVAPSGRISFLGTGLHPAALEALVSWVDWHVDDHPELAVLRGARFLDIGPDQRVEAVHELPRGRWSLIPFRAVPGTPGAAAELIAERGPDLQAWFWMTAAASDGLPALALSVQDDDPQAEALADLARGLGVREPAVRGVATRLPTGRIVLAASAPITLSLGAARSVLSAHSDLSVLDGALVAQVDEAEHLVAATVEPLQDLASTCATLQALSREETAFFWFTDGDVEGRARLLVAPDREDVLGSLRTWKGSGRDLLGQVGTPQPGMFIFVAQEAFPDFVQQLSAWVGLHRGAWPILLQLVGARFLRRRDGEVVSRHADDASWQVCLG